MIIALQDKNDTRLNYVSKNLSFCGWELEEDCDSRTFINHLADELITTANGTSNLAGLAAPQIGRFHRMFYIAGSGIYVNPHFIIGPKTDIVESVEGCLSIPGKQFLVWRYKGIKIVYQDYLGDWFVKKDLPFDFERIYQHEFDHLVGQTLYQTGVEA